MADPTDDSSPVRSRTTEGASRVFFAADGTRWHVSERPYADYDRRRGPDFPADWHTLSDEELLALSWGA